MNILTIVFVVIAASAVVVFLIYSLVIEPAKYAGKANEGYDYEEARNGYPYVSGSTWRGRLFNVGYYRARTSRIRKYEQNGIHYYRPVRNKRRRTYGY